MDTEKIKRVVARESALFLVLGSVGLVALPICIYLVGTLVFGAYESGGLGAFFGALQRELRSGEWSVLFLLLSPWILWQLARLTIRGFRRLGPSAGSDLREHREKL